MRVTKQKYGALLTLAAATLILAAPLSAQKGKGRPAHLPKYDVATEATFEGVVAEVVEKESPMGWTGIHLMLTSGEATFEVHLGPKTFLEEKDFTFVAGDELAILGARPKGDDETSWDLIAREITRGDKTLVLRDEKGFPVWRGQGPRSQGRGKTD